MTYLAFLRAASKAAAKKDYESARDLVAQAIESEDCPMEITAALGLQMDYFDARIPLKTSLFRWIGRKGEVTK